MKKILLYTTALPVLLLSTNTAIGQNKNSLEGVWKVVEVKISYSKDSIKTDSNPQPGLMIFTKGYYSILAVEGGQPRPTLEGFKDSEHPTDAEKIARYESWRPFHANSGTYEIKGSKLMRRAIIAKGAGAMNRQTSFNDEFKLEGNTLWMTVARDPTTPEIRAKWTRIE